jgi:hypothetical protein
MMNLSKVYFFAFADDLAFVSANLSAIECAMKRLNASLPKFGMSVNAAKTCWMPFVPTASRYRVEEPSDFSLKLDRRYLQCVDEFKYLGYVINSFLSPAPHSLLKRDSMFAAAKSMGHLLRNLQITNLKSIRVYFHSLVASQLYGLECFNFKAEDFYRAAKLFVQTIFCLPDSYPINVVRSLLNLQVFDAMLLNSRIRFLERISVAPNSMILGKAMNYDADVLRTHRAGFSHDLTEFLYSFFDVTDLEFLSVNDISSLQELRDQIVVQRMDEFRVSFRQSSGLSFWPDISSDATMPLAFGEFLGTMEYEQARIVLLFVGDVFRYSLSATRSVCPFCPVELHAVHLFNCPNCPFQNELPSWSTFLNAIHSSHWLVAVSTLFLCLQRWFRGSNFFQAKLGERIDDFFRRDLA